MSENESVITICIDIDRRRIRVNKNVLDNLDNPPFIQFLINTDKRIFAVRGINKELPNSQTIRIVSRDKMRSKHYEFSSTTLANKLLDAMDVENKTGSYKLYGVAVPNENIVLFSFDTLQKMK